MLLIARRQKGKTFSLNALETQNRKYPQRVKLKDQAAKFSGKKKRNKIKWTVKPISSKLIELQKLS